MPNRAVGDQAHIGPGRSTPNLGTGTMAVGMGATHWVPLPSRVALGAPVVVLDAMEKGLSGSKRSGQTDGGTAHLFIYWLGCRA